MSSMSLGARNLITALPFVFAFLAAAMALYGFALLGFKAAASNSEGHVTATFSGARLGQMLIIPTSAALMGFAILRLGPIDGIYDRLAQPSVQSELVLEMNTKESTREWLEPIAEAFRRIILVSRASAVAAMEADETIRIKFIGSSQVAADALMQAFARSYPLEYQDMDIARADDGLVLTLRDSAKKRRTTQTIETTIGKLRQRLADLSVARPVVQREGDHRILILAPGFGDIGLLKSTLGRRGTLTIHRVVRELADPKDRGILDAESVILPQRDGGKYFGSVTARRGNQL